MTESLPVVWVSRPTFDDEIARLRPQFEVRAEPADVKFAPAELAAKLADCDGAIVGGNLRIGAQEIARAKRLRIVANLAAGFDNLDLPTLTAAGIAATNVGGVLSETVADYVWALLLGAARRTHAAERYLRAGAWHGSRFTDWLGVDVHGRTLGILGMGRIGQAVARRAAGFDMTVLYHNRTRLPEATERTCHARYVNKDALLRESDFVVLLLPLTPSTRHAVGADELAQMKPDAVLVNVGRGGTVDDAALAGALADGRLAAAALDVYEGEPNVHPDLLALDNVVLSPHIASATVATRRAMTAMSVDSVLAWFGHGPHAGHPPNLLNPEVLASRGQGAPPCRVSASRAVPPVRCPG